ncbi:MAG: Rieske 2Fe-2S domain-containing protein, partial [Bacteroidetes bacterium]|nr:Rieske 2Fe-2S domain-containing protein [Bacteroidota bacterium]
GERVAVFKHGNRFSAVSNVCQHQNGPLGEGRIIDGYITCPWHGYQYCPLTGKSPEPFTERIPTFDVRVEGNSVFVSDHPNQLGEEGQFESSSSDDSSSIP